MFVFLQMVLADFGFEFCELGGDLSKDDENAKEFGLPNDTVRYEDEEFESQFETQELEDADCHGFADSDGEGTDTTLVLEDNGDNDDGCRSDDTPTSFRKRKDLVLDSDASADKCASGLYEFNLCYELSIILPKHIVGFTLKDRLLCAVRGVH